MASDSDRPTIKSLDAAADSPAERKPKNDLDSITSLVSEPESSANRGDVSVSTIARMMGLATLTDLKLLGSKLDLLIGRVNAMSARMERVVNAVSNAPTGSDLERIDVQIGSLKSLIRETFGKAVSKAETTEQIQSASRVAQERTPPNSSAASSEGDLDFDPSRKE